MEEQPGLEDADPMSVQWLECILPPQELGKIKNSVDNIGHKWRKEVIKKADNPFSEVYVHLLLCSVYVCYKQNPSMFEPFGQIATWLF